MFSILLTSTKWQPYGSPKGALRRVHHRASSVCIPCSLNTVCLTMNHWLQCILGSPDSCPHTSMQTVHRLVNIHPLLVQEVSGRAINSTAPWPRQRRGCLHDQGHQQSGFLTPLCGPKETIPKDHSQKLAHFPGSGCLGPMAI